MAQAYKQSVESYGISVIAFSALDIACIWLGLDTSMVLTRLDRAQKAHSAH